MAQEKKPGLYLFNKFVRQLIDNNAEIRYKNRIYKPGQKNLTIKSLVGEICQIDDNKLDEITRNVSLKKKNSRKYSVREDQETIINHLDFYLDNNDFRPNSKFHLTPTDFFVKEDGISPLIYPNIPQAINEKIYKLIREYDVLTISLDIDSDPLKQGPFYPLTKKINKALISEDESFQAKVNNHLKTLADEYRAVFLRNLETIKEQEPLPINDQKETNEVTQFLIPGYSLNLKLPFEECFKEKMDIQMKQPQSTSFSDKQTWFDRQRYYRLKTLMPELLEKGVSDWPKWILEHVLLTEMEYHIIYKHSLELAYEEVKNNVKYSLHMSSDGAKIDVQEDFNDIHGLGKKLSQFKFPGKVENLIDIHRGTILEGPFSKFPEYLVARNTHTSFEIKFDILKALIGFFHKRICQGIGFSFPEKHKQLNEYGELANKLIEDTSENE
jgi:hypothetical protein